MVRSRFDAAPLQADLDSQEPRWQKWFQDVWAYINATSLPIPTVLPPSSSPTTYRFQQGGRGRIIPQGGSITQVEWSRDGITWLTVGYAAGNYFVAQGDYIRISFSTGITTYQILD